MARFNVHTVKDGDEGLIATDWEIHQTGALIFKNYKGATWELVLAYAPGAWTSFFEDDQ